MAVVGSGSTGGWGGLAGHWRRQESAAGNGDINFHLLHLVVQFDTMAPVGVLAEPAAFVSSHGVCVVWHVGGAVLRFVAG